MSLTPLLKSFQWRPILWRINRQVLTMAFKVLYDLASGSLCDSIPIIRPLLYSSYNGLLAVSPSKLLPQDLCTCCSHSLSSLFHDSNTACPLICHFNREAIQPALS